MTSLPSFRHRVALRIALAVSLLLVLSSLLGYAALHAFLYRRLDATVLRLAQIEVAATSDSPDEHVHFHDSVFLSGGPGHATILERFAEVWSLEGVPVIRTENLGVANLPLPDAVRREVTESEESRLFSFTWRGQSYRSILYPLGLLGPLHAPHLLQVAASTSEADALLRQVLAFIVALVILGFGLGGAIGWWLAGYALRPVLEIIDAAEGFRVATPGQQISAHTDTMELRRLVAVLNTMLLRVDAAFANQQRFLADAGHAIKTPLTILRGDIDVALRQVRSSMEYRSVLEQALADLREVSQLSDDLITLSRADGGGLQIQRIEVDLSTLVTRVAARFNGAAQRAGMTLSVAPGPAHVVTGDPALLERALANLVDNAMKYGLPGNHVTLNVILEGSMIAIVVSDTGPGLSEADLDASRARFYRGTTSHGISGSGLGLAIVDAIAQEHGGRLSLESVQGAGLTARMEVSVGSVE
ncbi:MAG: ATP-binding protein [Gemmatimonadota bacterium]